MVCCDRLNGTLIGGRLRKLIITDDLPISARSRRAVDRRRRSWPENTDRDASEPSRASDARAPSPRSMSDAASIIPRTVSLPRVSAASSRRVSADRPISLAVGTARSRAGFSSRSVAVRRDAMASLGTMKPEIVADGVLHVRTPLIISKPMRCASPHHRPTLLFLDDGSIRSLTASPTPDIRSERLGTDVYIKLDALQPSGSFKLRGTTPARRRWPRALGVSSPLPAETRAWPRRRSVSAWARPPPWSSPKPPPSSSRRLDPTAPPSKSTGRSGPRRMNALSRQPPRTVNSSPPSRTSTRGPDTPPSCTMRRSRRLGLGDVIPGAVVTCVGGGGLLAGILQGLDEVGWGRDASAVAETVGADSWRRRWTRDASRPSRDRVRGQTPGRGVPPRPSSTCASRDARIGWCVRGGWRTPAWPSACVHG